jgi:hypothetical protein
MISQLGRHSRLMALGDQRSDRSDVRGRLGDRICGDRAVPPAQAPAEPTSSDEGWPNFGSMTSPWTPLDPDHREPALRVDPESIRVHQVRRVEFETTEYVVRRHRWERREPDF